MLSARLEGSHERTGTDAAFGRTIRPMSTGTSNVEHEPRMYRPCVTGLKCPAWYRSDYLRRVQQGFENQGTGSIVEDLTAKLRAINSPSRVEGRDCTDACPIPGERSNVEGPDGKLYDGMMNANDKLHPTAKGYQV